MGRYQAYPEYKDSGVDGLGSIPLDWNVMQLKRSVTSCINGIWGSEPNNDGMDTIVIRVADFDRQRLSINHDGFTLRKIEEKEKVGRLLRRGDLLLEKSGGGEKTLVGQVVLFDKDFDAVTSNFVAKMTPNSGFESRYLNYVFCRFYSQNINLCSIKQNTGIQNLDSASYLSEEFGFPSFIEQETIANFLDHETAKIDTLIEKQQQLIQLLKEKRQAVISHAVTKGLNPNAPMKDSGVEWLGQVPEHWVCKSYRYACQIYRGKFGHRPRNDPAFYDGEYPFIQTGDVAQAGKYITEYKQTLNEKGKAVSQLFPAGTLVMTIAANIGDTAILGFEAYAPDSIVGFKPKEDIDLEFLRYSLMAALPALVQTSTQSTQANLNIERVGAVQAAFPTKFEQQEIVKFIDEMLDKYASLEAQALLGVEILQERRTALISAAVTGKIDVRNWQAPTN